MIIGVDARAALSRHRRGEGKSLLRLYREISLIRPQWNILFYGYPGGAPSGIENVTDRTFDTPGFRFNVWENFALPLRARLDKVDVLHCAGTSAPRFRGGIPIVMTVHDLIPLVFDDGMTKAQVVQFEKQVRYGLASADAVIAVSEKTKADIVALFGYPAPKIKVVYWGCDGDDRADDADTTAAEARLRDMGLSERFIMAFGGGAPRKNTERLISAFSRTAQGVGGVDLVLIGAGGPEIKRRYQSMAQLLDISDRVIILDFIDDDILDALYRKALCLAYPSLYEGFGLPRYWQMTNYEVISPYAGLSAQGCFRGGKRRRRPWRFLNGPRQRREQPEPLSITRIRSRHE
jgi:glycosyltransferase involved in cell wall biosynthesis